MHLIWLLGGHEPDHNTLWRFWRDNQKALRRLFRQVVRVASGAGLVGAVLHALDGTRIEAADSTQQACRGRRLKKKLAQLEAQIDELKKAIGGCEGESEGGYRLPEELQDRNRLRQRIQEELAKEETQEPREARVRRLGDGRKRLGFNAQTVVDSDSQLIVAEEVVADENRL